jgi:hypothetical protein
MKQVCLIFLTRVCADGKKIHPNVKSFYKNWQLLNPW